jgi:hypothetical protein
VASLLEESEVARQLAMQKGQASAAVQATMGKAKLTGLIVDRREVGGRDAEVVPRCRGVGGHSGACIGAEGDRDESRSGA